MKGKIKCGKMQGTNAKDENEMFKGEIRGADSAEGKYEKHEGENKM